MAISFDERIERHMKNFFEDMNSRKIGLLTGYVAQFFLLVLLCIEKIEFYDWMPKTIVNIITVLFLSALIVSYVLMGSRAVKAIWGVCSKIGSFGWKMLPLPFLLRIFSAGVTWWIALVIMVVLLGGFPAFIVLFCYVRTENEDMSIKDIFSNSEQRASDESGADDQKGIYKYFLIILAIMAVIMVIILVLPHRNNQETASNDNIETEEVVSQEQTDINNENAESGLTADNTDAQETQVDDITEEDTTQEQGDTTAAGDENSIVGYYAPEYPDCTNYGGIVIVEKDSEYQVRLIYADGYEQTFPLKEVGEQLYSVLEDGQESYCQLYFEGDKVTWSDEFEAYGYIKE